MGGKHAVSRGLTQRNGFDGYTRRRETLMGISSMAGYAFRQLRLTSRTWHFQENHVVDESFPFFRKSVWEMKKKKGDTTAGFLMRKKKAGIDISEREKERESEKEIKNPFYWIENIFFGVSFKFWFVNKKRFSFCLEKVIDKRALLYSIFLLFRDNRGPADFWLGWHEKWTIRQAWIKYDAIFKLQCRLKKKTSLHFTCHDSLLSGCNWWNDPSYSFLYISIPPPLKRAYKKKN